MSNGTRAAAYFWSNKNGDASCTGASRSSATSRLGGGPTWSFKDPTRSLVSHHPCIDHERNIYLVHRHGVARKFSPNGTVLWTSFAHFRGLGENVMTGGPAIMDGLLYVGLTDGSVVAHDMASGSLRWRVKHAAQSGMDSWSMAAFHGMAFAAVRREARPAALDLGGNNRIVAMEGRSGKLLWHWDADMDFYNWIGSFADVGGPPSLVFADQFGHPFRVGLCDGRTVWGNRADLGPRFMTTGGAIVGPGGHVYVTSNNLRGPEIRGRLSAYEPRRGGLVWTRELPLPANNAPVIGRLGRGSELSLVIATGMNPAFPDPAADKAGTWFGIPVGYRSTVQSFDPGTGEPRGWSYTPPAHNKTSAYGEYWPDHICLPDAWSNGAIGGDGTFYVGHMSGNVFALKDVNGDGFIDEGGGEVSKYFGQRCYQGSAAIAPGMLVTAPCDGMHVFRGL